MNIVNIARAIIHNNSQAKIQDEFYRETGEMFGYNIQSAVYTNEYADIVFDDGSVLTLKDNGWSTK